MPPHSSGLTRDINLVRRRWWLFIPFFFVGLLVAMVFGSAAGEANAVASMQLETVVQDLVVGGDRGLRIFEAQTMTQDPRFKQEVIDKTGDPNFDYARYSISLAPISVADGVSRGVLTVSIKDESKTQAEKYRQAFVDVFTEEYTQLDGLWRTRFIEKKQEVVDLADQQFHEDYEKLAPPLRAQGIPVDDLIRPKNNVNIDLLDALAQQEGDLRGQAAMAQATNNAALAAQLEAAIDAIQAERAEVSDGSLPPELSNQVVRLRTLSEIRNESYIRLGNAQVAVTSAQSSIETSYSFSGGLAGTYLGRAAVVIAVTLVFGLIAIYGLEWLSQVRRGVEE